MGIESEKLSRLKGKGLERQKQSEDSRLTGTLVEKNKTEHVEELSALNLEGKVLIQRDSGKEFVVEKVHDEGAYGKTMALLRSADGTTVSKGLDTLIGQLSTSGEAWRLKE